MYCRHDYQLYKTDSLGSVIFVMSSHIYQYSSSESLLGPFYTGFMFNYINWCITTHHKLPQYTYMCVDRHFPCFLHEVTKIL